MHVISRKAVKNKTAHKTTQVTVKISESSKQSHTDTINVLRNIREKKKEPDKRTQLFERLKKHGYEKLHKHEEKAALSSMQETLQEQNIYEIQEAIILSPLKGKETPQKNGTVDTFIISN